MMDLTSIQPILTGFTLGVPRMLAALAMLPFLTRQNMPALLRVGVATTFTLPILPMLIAQTEQTSIHTAWLMLLILKETAIGMLLGFAVAIPFWAAEAAGFVIDNQRGATAGAVTNPMTGNEVSTLATLVEQAYTVLFLIMGGLTLMLGMIYQSYTVWPVTAGLPHFDPGFAKHYLELLDTLIRTAIVLAAPAMICMLLAEIALAIVSLFAPQMQVFFLAMPIKSGIALFVLVLYFPHLLRYLETTVLDLPRILSVTQQFIKLTQ